MSEVLMIMQTDFKFNGNFYIKYTKQLMKLQFA